MQTVDCMQKEADVDSLNREKDRYRQPQQEETGVDSLNRKRQM